jgi:hypothetical protein
MRWEIYPVEGMIDAVYTGAGWIQKESLSREDIEGDYGTYPETRHYRPRPIVRPYTTLSRETCFQ